MRENYRYRSVKGMNDVFPGEARRFRCLEDLARVHFARYGCGEIRTPLVEHTVLFERGVGEGTDIVNKEMFYVPAKDENDAGALRRMVLRPEATASVVRAYVEHEIDKTAPGVQRYFYIGPMFRYERPQKGRLRQFHQIGVEWLGVASLDGDEGPGTRADRAGHAAAEDAEVVCLLWDLCLAAGVPGLELQLNSVGCPACRPGYAERLRTFAAGQADALCADCRKRIQSNPLRLFDCKVPACREIMTRAPLLQDHLCDACRDQQAGVEGQLAAVPIRFTRNPRMVRGLDYYTRTVFELVSNDLGAQNAVAAGGRYDNLVESLEGPVTPAVGWSLGVERLLDLLPAEEGPDRLDAFLLNTGPDPAHTLREVTRWRRAGLRVAWEKEARSRKAMLKRADRSGAVFAVFVGIDKLEIKHMATGEQNETDWQGAADSMLAQRRRNGEARP